MSKEKKDGIKRYRLNKSSARLRRRKRQLKKIPVKSLLEILPKEVMEQVALQTGVDEQVKHLFGPLLVMLFMLAILDGEDKTQQSLADLYNSTRFSSFSGKGGHQTYKTSISSRLAKIKCEFLEQLYDQLIERLKQKYSKQLGQQYGWLTRFDSTMLSLCASLTDIGMRVGAKPKEGEGKVQIKVSIGLEGFLPSTLKVYHEQSMLSEEKALKQAIESNPDGQRGVIVFDMGLKSRKTFKHFDLDGRSFVTRVNNPRYEQVSIHKQIKGRTHGTLIFHSDEIVQLYQSGNKKDSLMQHQFRLITATCQRGKNAGTTYFFLTNMLELTAFEIADIYLKRWDIEVFFRFLKQEIGLKNLLSTNENGIKAVIYLRLITGTLLWAYIHLNNRTDYKKAKKDFRDEVDWAINFAIAQLIAATGITERDKLLPDFQGIMSSDSL